ncbi:hypothetical protein ACIREM_14835 [Streptomyces shenzhenensis]|uniref:hypothetical protein n=1 Tax=Streptomyces shenzhenensis TaxID=943815 RepID=UPI0037F3A571
MCSGACRIWTLRAERAVSRNDTAEAVRLLRLAELLDARTGPRDRVPGLFDDDEADT